MSYEAYLDFYGLENSEETRQDWLYNEWHHGRAYKFEGEFYSTETGEKLEAGITRSKKK